MTNAANTATDDTQTTATARPRKVSKPDRTALPSYWLATVTYDSDNGTSSMMMEADTMPEALSVAFKSATYYLGIGYRSVDVRIKQLCAACEGTGETFVRRSANYGVRRMCKACKGQPILSSIPAFPVRCHENVAIVDPHNIRGVDVTV